MFGMDSVQFFKKVGADILNRDIIAENGNKSFKLSIGIYRWHEIDSFKRGEER